MQQAKNKSAGVKNLFLKIILIVQCLYLCYELFYYFFVNMKI